MTAAVLSPQARRDVLEAARWIAADAPAAARALRDALAIAAHRLGAHPDCGVARPELAEPPVRFLILTGFPYVLVYDAATKPPLILRVLHGARDLPEILRDI